MIGSRKDIRFRDGRELKVKIKHSGQKPKNILRNHKEGKADRETEWNKI